MIQVDLGSGRALVRHVHQRDTTGQVRDHTILAVVKWDTKRMSAQGTKLVKGIHGTSKQIPMTEVQIGVGKYEMELTVAVVEGCETVVLLGLDTGIFDYCMALALEQKKQRHVFVKVTRCESKKQKEREKQEEQDNERDAAKPRTVKGIVDITVQNETK